MLNLNPEPPPAPVVNYDGPCPGCAQVVPWRSQLAQHRSDIGGPTTVTIALCLCPACPEPEPVEVAA